MAVHPDGKHVFVNEEAGAKLTCYDWDAETGTLTPKQSLSTLPEGFAEQVFTAECSLNADGDVAYVADRVWPPVPGKDAGLLATFGVGSGVYPLHVSLAACAWHNIIMHAVERCLGLTEGHMELRGFTEVGRHPRHFKIDPTGQWMICTSLHEHRADVFKLDDQGVPQPTTHSLMVPSVTHSLWIEDDRLPPAHGTTTTTVVHPDGTKISVTTTGANL